MAHIIEHLYHAYLTRSGHMRSTAGAHVRTRYFNYPHPAAELLFAAVLHAGKFLCRGQKGLNRYVAPDGPVGLQLAERYVIRRELHGKVQRHGVRAHVEADVLSSEEPVHGAGEDVLAAVPLHAREAQSPINFAGYRRPRLERLRDYVIHRLVRLAHTYYGLTGESTGVGVLSAAAREESRAVEHDGTGPALLSAGEHLCGECPGFTVCIIKFIGHFYHLCAVNNNIFTVC